MKNKLFLEKSLELIALGEQLIQECKDRHESRELDGAVKVIKRVLWATGYRKERIKVETVPNPNIVRDARAKVEAEKNGAILKGIEERKAEDPNTQKSLDKAKEKLVKKLNSGKKINTSAKDKEEVKAMYKHGNNIADISETLWIVEDSIYKILGIGNDSSKAVLADNSNNEGLND